MKVAMVFPGYGSQFVGMAKELYDESRLMQEYFEEASSCLNVNFVKLCFASSELELAKMDYAYESIFLVSSSIAALLKQENIVPDIVAGFGVGEYSAIAAAQGLSLPDGLYFLSKYAQFYQELLNSFSARIIKINGLESGKVEKLCAELSTEQDIVSVAMNLSDKETVVSGIQARVELLAEAAKSAGAKKIEELPLDVGLHSSLMLPVVEQLAVYLEKVDFKDLNVPLVESLQAKKLLKGDVVRSYIMKKINHTIKWHSVVDALASYDVLIEVGPGSKLSVKLADRYPNKKVMAINKPADIEILKNILNQNKLDESA